MHAEKKRVFVGNLPPDTTQTDITRWFNKFGSVLSVEIKQRPNSSTFAFLDFKTDEDKLKSCFATLSAKKWNGNKIKLELAKESFLSRLEKERQEHNKSQPCCSSDCDCMVDTNEKFKKRSVEELVFTKKKVKTETVCELNDCCFDEESVRSLDSSSGSETLYNGKLNMFSGTRAAVCNSDDDRSHSQSIPDSKMSQSTCAATGMLERLNLFSDVWKDQPVNCGVIKDDRTVTRKGNYKKQSPSEEGRRLLAEEKRKKSVDEKRKSSQKQKEAIKLSLSFVDSGHRNKKTVFDSDDYETKAEDTVKRIDSHEISSLSSNNEMLEKSTKKTILFEDSSDDENDGNIRLKSQFEGSKGQKLLELQSQFASDKRFALDERFYESDEEVLAEASGAVTTLGDEDERRRQFEILQDVLGHQIEIEGNKKDKYKKLSMVRFDPMNPDHAKFKKNAEPKIQKNVTDISPDKIPKVVRGKGEDRTENVLVSKEKFYTVAETLKDSLRKQDEGNAFSLRKLFDVSDGGSNYEENGETYSAKTLNKQKQKNWTINQFKYDSSDSEEETETVSCNKTNNLQQNLNENFHFGESFFFKARDPRFQEGLEFFNSSHIQDESYDFAKHRRELKQIVRSKVKNNVRNHRPWRKKLGGQKAKRFRYT